MPFTWGVPVTIPCPPGGTGPIPDWAELKFNPLGVYNLRRRLGALRREPGVFTEYQRNFTAADIAWFAAGAATDDTHQSGCRGFHQLFDIAREGGGKDGSRLRGELEDTIQGLTFDMVCSLSLLKVNMSLTIR